MEKIINKMKGKKALSMLLVLIMMLSVLTPAISSFGIKTEAATSEADGAYATIITASDFQDGRSGNLHEETFSTLIQKAEANGMNEPDGFILGGDYDGSYADNHDTPTAYRRVESVITNAYPYFNRKNIVNIQGNHDINDPSVIDKTGPHEYDDYIVYVINNSDYPAGTGGTAAYNKTMETAQDLSAYFNKIKAEGETRPIFIATHIPLHHNARNPKANNKDANGTVVSTGWNETLYGRVLFDVINENAKIFDIVFLFGHNHSGDYDDYIGGSVNYIGKGETIRIADYNITPSETSYTNETLNFTYMNYGYVGYSNNVVDNTLTINTFEICPDKIVATRYCATGQYGEAEIIDRNMKTDSPSVYVDAYNTATVGSATGVVAIASGFDDPAFTWTSSNEGIAKVSGSDRVAKIAYNAVGTVTIKVKVTERSDPSKTAIYNYDVNVTAADGTEPGVSIYRLKEQVDNRTLDYYQINIGDTVALSGSYYGLTVNASTSWSSSNDSVVKVNQYGLVTFVGVGTANITYTATDNGVTYSAQVKLVVSTEKKVEYKYVQTTTITAGKSYVIASEYNGVKAIYSDRTATHDNVIALSGSPTAFEGSAGSYHIQLDDQSFVWNAVESANSNQVYLQNADSGLYLAAYATGTNDVGASVNLGYFELTKVKPNNGIWQYSNNILQTTDGLKWYTRSNGVANITSGTGRETIIFEQVPLEAYANIEFTGEVVNDKIKTVHLAVNGRQVALEGDYVNIQQLKSESWTSSNTNVATINDNGVVTFKGVEGETVITYTATDAVNNNTVTASFTISALLTAETTRLFKYTENVVPGRKYIIANRNDADSYGLVFSSIEVTYTQLLADRVDVVVEDGASYIEIPGSFTEVIWTPEAASGSSFYLKNDANGEYLYANTDGTYDSYDSLDTTALTSGSYSTNTEQYTWTYENGSKLYNNFAYTDAKLGAQTKTYMRVRSAEFIGTSTEAASKVYFYEEIPAKPKAVITSRYEILGETIERTEICPFQTETFLPVAENFPDNSKVSFAWSSNNASIATIDQTGKITYKGKAGKVAITLTATSQVQDTTGVYPVVTSTVTIEVIGGVGYVDPPGTVYVENAYYETTNLVPGQEYVFHAVETSGNTDVALSYGMYSSYSRLEALSIGAPALDANHNLNYVIPNDSSVVWVCEAVEGEPGYVYLRNKADGTYLFVSKNSEGTNKLGATAKGSHPDASTEDMTDAFKIYYNSKVNALGSKQISNAYGIGNFVKSSGGYYYAQVNYHNNDTSRVSAKVNMYTKLEDGTDEPELPDGDVYLLTENFEAGKKYLIASSNIPGDASANVMSNVMYDDYVLKAVPSVIGDWENIPYIANPGSDVVVFEAVPSNIEGYVKLKTSDGKYLVMTYKEGLVGSNREIKLDSSNSYLDVNYSFKAYKEGDYNLFENGESNGRMNYKASSSGGTNRWAATSTKASVYIYELVEKTDTPVEDNTPVITEIRMQDEFGSVDITRTIQYRYDTYAGATEQILRYIRGLASGYEVAWSVSDTSIATIDQNGLLTYMGGTGYVDVILTVTGEDFAGNPVKRTLKTTFDVSANQDKTRIAIPETVYMTPANGASTIGQVYVNNVMNANDSYNIQTVAERVDDMYFGLYVANAKSFTVSVSNATDPSNDINLCTSSGSVVSESTEFNFNSDDVFEADGQYSLRFSGAGLQPGEKAVAKWDITVTMGNGSTKYTYTTYTVMYAPQRSVGATAEARQVENSQNEIISWITGANGVDHSKWSPLGSFHADKSTAGYFKEDPLYNQNPPTNSTGETADDLINVVATTPAEGTRYENAYVVQAATNGNDGSFAKSYLGLLTVDKSRYTNTNQIPNLKIGYDILRKSGWIKDSVHTYANYYTLGTSTSFTSTDISAVPGGDWVQERYFTNFAESHSLPDRYTLVPSYNVSDIDGKYIHVLNKSQCIQDFVFYIEREYANAATSVLCTVTDKSILRERVVSGYNVIDGTSEFKDALMNAATVLGDPAATQEEIDRTSRELYEAMAEKADVYYALKYDNLFSTFEYSQFANSMRVVGNYGTASYLNGTITVVNDTLSNSNEVYTEYGPADGYYNVALKPNTEYVFEYDVTTTLAAQAFMFFYNSSGGNADTPTNMSIKVNDGAWDAKTEQNSWWGNYTDGAGTYHYAIKFTTGPNTIEAGFRFGNTSSSPVESTFYNIKLIDSAHYYEDAVYSKTESIHKEYTAYGTLITPTRPGYIFKGWKDINGSTVTGTNNATEHLTIYSQWEAVQYTVKFNGNGGAGSTTSAALSLDQPAQLPGDFARDNHTLLGWSFSDDATTADFKVGEQITVEDAHDYMDNKNQVTLYAVWERNYSVYYSANGGTGTVAHTYNPRSQAHVLPDDSTISMDRHVFLGWALDPDATEPNYLPGEKLYIGDVPSQYVNETKQEVILHAVWMLKEYVVEDTIVIDFGLPVKINVLANDPEVATGTISAIGKGVQDGTVLNTDGYTSSRITEAAAVLTLANGTAKIEGSQVIYTPASTNYENEETFYYEFKSNDNKFYYTTVRIVPATSIYFEESMFTFNDSKVTVDGVEKEYKWQDVGTPVAGVFQDEDRPGSFTIADANNVYGADSAYNNITTYSMGSAKYITVDQNSNKANPLATASFTFTGTGFDLFTVTDNKAGLLTVSIYKDGKKVKGFAVNTYYGYTYDKDANEGQGGYVATNEDNALFQVPAIRARDLGYGTYTVVVEPKYSYPFDVNLNKEYRVYVDSVRIYDPMGSDNDLANSVYLADGEFAPNYLRLRDTIVTKDENGDYNVSTYQNSALFFDGFNPDMNDVTDVIKNGPKNEVYLAKGQAVAFNISATSNLNIASVQLGMKLINAKGNAQVTVMNTQEQQPTKINLSSTTEQYYKLDSAIVWDDEQLEQNIFETAYPVVILNSSDSDVVISLTSLKWAYEDAGAAISTFNIIGDEQTLAFAPAAIERALMSPAPEVNPTDKENIVIAPTEFDIQDGNAGFTVTTTAEVEKVTVDGVELTDCQLDENGNKVWKYTFQPKADGANDFEVLVYDYQGNVSESIIVSITVTDSDPDQDEDTNTPEDDSSEEDGEQSDNDLDSLLGSIGDGSFGYRIAQLIFALLQKIFGLFGGATV